MAATNGTKQQASALALLKRADSRWARDRADDPAAPEYLEHLATYLQPVAPNKDATPPVDERELTMLREQAASAENTAAARRAELDQARAQVDELRQQLQAADEEDERLNDLRTELQKHVDAQERRAKKAETERDKLGEQLDLERIQVGELRKECENQQRQVAEIHLAMESARRERDQVAEQLAEARNHTCPAPAGDTEALNARIAELKKEALDNIKLIGDLRADYDAAAADTQKLADDLETMRADRDALVARVVATDQHHCTWQWHGPDEPIKPCSCGRAAPRYELREVS